MALVVKDGNGTNQNLPLYDQAYSAIGVTFTPVAAPTDWLVLQGSATKIVRLKRITFAGFATTGGDMLCALIKRSDAGTLGSAVLTGVTACPLDSANSAATAVLSTVGTANYTTVGTIVGVGIRAARAYLNIVTTGNTEKIVWDFTTRGDQAPTLRAATEFLVLNGQAGTLPAGSKFDFEVQWEEGSA